MIRASLWHLFCLALALAPLPALGQCRLALALGLDVSGSVDAREYVLQVQGTATALRDPAVASAFLVDPEAPVRLLVYEWSGPSDQRLLLDWTEIRTASDLARASGQLLNAAPPPRREGDTALGGALLFGARALASQPCWQRVLDISGDGPGNTGPHPGALDDPQLDAITVNGLVIGPTARANTTKDLTNVPTLEEYYRRFVLRGPNAFAETARDFDDFARAMQRKLLRELRLPGLAQVHEAPQTAQ